MSEAHVQLAAEPALELGHFAISNAMTSTLFVSLVIIILAILVRRKAGIIPSRLQVLAEMGFTFFLDQFEEGVGAKRARIFAPIVMTFFLFILISNDLILFPFISSIVTHEGIFFRTPTTDYSLTIALALMSVGFAHIIAFIISPLGHLGTYFRVAGFLKVRSLMDLLTAGIDFFLGLLEIIGDMAKIVSLATRLFGNIFAGEVVIAIIMSLMVYTQFIAPIPFILIASFAGIIQAFVFSLLTVLFISNNVMHASHKH